MNQKDGFDFNEILWSFLDQSRRWAKNYERDHPLPLAWRPYRRFRAAKGLFTTFKVSVRVFFVFSIQ